MARLVYSAIGSLDGYVEDRDGRFEWAAPDDELLAFVNELERPLGTYLYGRRMYETMVYWDTAPEDGSLAGAFGRLWRAADKVVYSRTLQEVTGARTRLECDFEPGTVARLKESATSDVSVGGSQLAAVALAHGLVDEIHLLLQPVVVGGGKPILPDGVHLELELLDLRRFGNGAVHLHYRVR